MRIPYKLLTALLLFSLSLGQFARIPMISQRFYFFDVYITFYALLFLLVLFRKGIKELKLDIILFFFVSFTIWASISLLRSFLVYSYEDPFFQFFYLFRWICYLVSSLAVVHYIKWNYLNYLWLLRLVMLSGAFIAFAGFIQLVLLPDFTVLDSSYGWDPHNNRLASTFFDPNFAGAYLVITLSVYLGLVYLGIFSPLKQRLYFALYFILPLVGLFLTFSRSAWGMFAVVIFIFGILKYRALLLIFVLLCFGVYFAVPRVQTRLSGITDPADSAHFRLESWGNALKVFEESPVFGVGYNSYRYAQIEQGLFSVGETGGNSGAGADASGLLVLATTGVVGFVLFSLGYLATIWAALKRLKDGGVIVLSVLIGLFLESVFINSVFYPQILFLWVFLALSASVLSIKNTNHSDT